MSSEISLDFSIAAEQHLRVFCLSEEQFPPRGKEFTLPEAKDSQSKGVST